MKKEQKRVRVDVAGPRSFLVPHRQARTRPSPNSAVFSDVKVFDEKGNYSQNQEDQLIRRLYIYISLVILKAQ